MLSCEIIDEQLSWLGPARLYIDKTPPSAFEQQEHQASLGQYFNYPIISQYH